MKKKNNPFAGVQKSRLAGTGGPHRPARQKIRQEIIRCLVCRKPLDDPDDDSSVCIECEIASHSPDPPDPIDDD